MSSSTAHPSTQTVSYQGLAAVRCLAGGVDALYLSGGASVPPGLLDVLEDLRARATDGEMPVPFGDGWRIAGHGWGKYRFCLTHERGRLGLTSSERLPALRFQPIAEALHGLGPAGVVEWVDGIARELVGAVRWSVSRVDLFSDWQGWPLSGDHRHRFVCRATARKTYEESEEFTGFEFGTRTSGTVSARIYDKTVDIKRKGTDWWPDIWGDAFEQSQPVHRVEFEVRRQAIREFGLDQPAEVLDGAQSMWRELTNEWLSYRDPTADQTRSRWPIAPEWAAIQNAEIGGSAIGLHRTLDGRRQGSLRRLMPLLNGCLASFAALTGNLSIDEACGALPEALRDYELYSARSFEDRVDERVELRRAG